MAHEFEAMLKRKCESEGDVQKAIEILKNSSGIEVADELSIDHIKDSIHNLEEATDNSKSRKIVNFDDQYAQALIGLALKVKTRKH